MNYHRLTTTMIDQEIIAVTGELDLLSNLIRQKQPNRERQAAKLRKQRAVDKLTGLRAERVRRGNEKKVATPEISDHAFCQWLTRVYGVDVARIKREILNDEITTRIMAGQSRIDKDGVTYVVRDNVVVTVIA